MGIKTVRYKANSIVYFKGDAPSRVYILKKGSIVTKSEDLKTNEDIMTMIKVGEFIGVKNVISNQPYSETVSTLVDSELVVFYKEDFEKFILNNNRVMMQTLVVFSNQLRKIHKDINGMALEPSRRDVEDDLFELGKYFKNQDKAEYADYCLKKYKKLYPNGKYHDLIDKGDFSPLSDDGCNNTDSNDDDTTLYFQEGENYLEEKNYEKAHECFQKVIDVPDGFHRVDALFYNGASLYQMKRYKDCIKNYTTFLTEHKDYKKINEVMYYVGSSYKEIGDFEQSKLFFKHVIKNAASQPIAKLALKELKGL